MDNPIILFDGVCNLCNASVNFIIKYDSKRKFRFAPIQSISGEKIFNEFKIPDKNNNSVILLQNKKIFLKSSAALEISRQLQFPFNLFIIFIIVPKFIRDKVYDFIAVNRYNWFGKREECMIPSTEIKDLFIE